MKKKILAVILTLAMIMTMFSGCGQKESTYFKEVKEICKITTGTSVTEMSMTYSGDESYDILKDKDGNQSIKVKYEMLMGDTKKVGMKISLKLGAEENYSEITTLVVDDKTLYLTVSPIVETIKKIDAETAQQIQDTLTQMGIGDSISVDIDQIMTAVGTKMPEESEDSQKEGLTFLNTMFETVEKDFGVLQGQDGDDYTLSLNGDNAEKAVDAVATFLKDDAQKLIDEYNKLVEKVYGSDNEMTNQIQSMMNELAAQIPDAIEAINNGKDDAVKAIKDSKMNIVSKAQVSGKDGSRVGKITFATGDIESEGQKANVSVTSEIKEGKPEIKEMIPENASDITTLLVTTLNMYSGDDEGNSDLDIIGDADVSTDMEIQ